MSWTPLYIDLNYEDFLGNSLSTFNTNFSAFDYYLEHFVSDTGQYLEKANDLSDVDDPVTSSSNLGIGTIADESEKAGAQAWVVFNGNTGQTIGGEFRCTIIGGSQYNVDKVVRTAKGIYKVYYTTPLKQYSPGGIGAVVGTASDGFLVVSARTLPSTTYCEIRTYSTGGVKFNSTYINCICY